MAKPQSNLPKSEYRPQIGQQSDYDPYKLEFIFSNDVVSYKCSCGNFRRLNSTYFCRHCMAIRCRSCVLHEVDTHYCQHCLEYIPQADPKFQINKCSICYQCPSCQHLLSRSIVSASSTSTEQLAHQQDDNVRRNCVLFCEFCRWSSKPFETEGNKILGGLDEVSVENSERINELMNYYKAISQKEEAGKKKRRFHSRSGNTLDLLKKYEIDKTLSAKLYESLRVSCRATKNLPASAANKYNLNESKSSEELIAESFEPAKASEEVEKLDLDFYYSKNFNPDDVSSIGQRVAQIELQPGKVVDFKPNSRSLLVKRSLRCKDCERNLCRGEFSPVSIRFKIQSSAYYHIPELKLRSDVYPLKLKLDEYNIVEFTLQNPTQSQVKVKLEENNSKMSKEDEDGEDKEIEEKLYELVLPKYELNLNPKDDTADYEHVPSNITPLNEETQITFQSSHKMGFFIKVKPKKQVDQLLIEFSMSHNVILLQTPRENVKPERVALIVRAKLGPVE